MRTGPSQYCYKMCMKRGWPVIQLIMHTQNLITCSVAHAQIEGPSGKALFQYYTNETTQLDFYICALSFGKNAVGDRQRIGATLSVYQNGQFIWWGPYNHRL